MGNIHRIAEEFGVSTATVSNALSGKGRVSAENARRIRARAREINYFPNPIARALKTGRSNIIGLVMPDLTQPLFPIFARSIENAAQQAGLGVLIADSMDDAAAQQEAIERLARQGVDGLIVIPQRGSDLADSRVPMAVIHTASHPQNTSSANHLQGGQLAANALLEAGHDRIALVGFDPSSEVQKDRIAGMISALEGRGAYQTVWLSRLDEAAVQEILVQHSAVIATSDSLAMQVMHMANNAGLTLPDDLSIIGFDDLPFSQHLRPALTTVRPDMQAIASHVVQYLVSCFDPATEPVAAKTFDMVLVSRASVARPAGKVAADVSSPAFKTSTPHHHKERKKG